MTDLDIIKEIEKELNVELNKLDKITWGNKGYTLNQKGRVNGLSLSDCEIKSLNRIISPLKELTNLAELDLGENELSNIFPLEDLTNLEELKLHANELTNISTLKEFKNLKKLDLFSNQLRDISQIKDLKKLTDLTLADNQINDISPLKDLKNLKQDFLLYQ